MDFFRVYWRKHRRKILLTTTCLGSGYLLYKLYTSHTLKLQDLQREIAKERENDEIIKTQLSYFELKGFTRLVLSVWSVTMLSLYIRVLVNILGRHLYVDTARALGTSHLLEELDLIDRDDEQKYLSNADFLVTNAMPSLVSDMQSVVKEVLKGKELKDVITTRVLQETVVRIMDVFMSNGSPHHWVDYLMMSQDTKLSRNTSDSSSSDETVSKFRRLVVETREVLTSTEFTYVVEISLKCFADALAEEMERQSVGGGVAAGMPLAKLLPQIEKTIPLVIDEPDKNQFLPLIRDLSEVPTFLYSFVC